MIILELNFTFTIHKSFEIESHWLGSGGHFSFKCFLKCSGDDQHCAKAFFGYYRQKNVYGDATVMILFHR